MRSLRNENVPTVITKLRRFRLGASLISTFFTFALPLAARASDCAPQFRPFAMRLARYEAVLRPPARAEIISAHDKLQAMSKSVHEAMKVEPTVAPSREFMELSRRLTKAMQTEMEAQGLIVETIRKPAYTLIRNGSQLHIPERETLALRSNGKRNILSREIQRIEKYTAAWDVRGEIEPGAAVSAFIDIDPALTALTDRAGYFTVHSELGRGITLDPKIFFDSNNVLIEVLRHELRHMQTHLHVSAGRRLATGIRIQVPRTGVANHISEDSVATALQAYTSFAIDELPATMAQLRESQRYLRTATSDTAALLGKSKSEESTNAILNGFTSFISKERGRARRTAEILNALISDSRKSLNAAEALLNRPGLTDRDLDTFMFLKSEPSPTGRKVLVLRLDPNDAQSTVEFQVDDNVARAGGPFRVKFLRSSLKSLSRYVDAHARELSLREGDLLQSPVARLIRESEPTFPKPLPQNRTPSLTPSQELPQPAPPTSRR